MLKYAAARRNNQRARGQATAEPQSLSEIRPTPEGQTELVQLAKTRAEPTEILRRSMKRHPEAQWFIGIRPAGWTVNRRTPALVKTRVYRGLEGSPERATHTRDI